MRKEKSLLVEFLGDKPEIRIWDFLLDNMPFEASKMEVAKATGLSRATVFSHWKKFEKYGVVEVSKRYGKIELFVLNTNNRLVKDIIQLENHLMERCAEKIAKKYPQKEVGPKTELVPA